MQRLRRALNLAARDGDNIRRMTEEFLPVVSGEALGCGRGELDPMGEPQLGQHV